MKPVMQTKFGDKKGNCFAACLASLLEISIEEIPDFFNKKEYWTKTCNDFLKTKGFCFVDINFDSSEMSYWILRSGYSIVTGSSPRHNCLHAVVAYQGEIVHDPHPDKTGIVEAKMIGYICLRCEGDSK